MFKTVFKLASKVCGDNGALSCEACTIKYKFSVRAVEACPVVFPWVVLVGSVCYNSVGVNEKSVPCAKVILSLRRFVYALAAYDVVDKIMVTNTASPTVKPLTFFIAHVVY